MIIDLHTLAELWFSGALDVALKSLLLLGPALLVLRALPALAASTRFLIACYALVATLALPVLSAALPGWHVVPEWRGETLAPVAATPLRPRDAAVITDVAGAADTAGTTTGRRAGAATIERGAAPGPAVFAFGLWLLGVAFLALRAAAGVRRLAVIRRQTGPLDDAGWRTLLHTCSTAQGVTAMPQLRVHPESIMPVTTGVRAPVILLPLEAQDWSVRRKRDVLMHELAHIRRGDLVTGWLALAACTVQWFNPLAWWAYRRLIIERERACDDLVLGSGADPSHYADCLLKTAVECRSLPAPCPGMARPSDLETRLVSVLDGRRRRAVAGRMAAAGLLAVAAGITIPVSTLATAANAPASVERDAEAGQPERREIERLRKALAAPGQALRAEARAQLEQLGRGHPVVEGLARVLFSQYSSDGELFRQYSSLRDGPRDVQTLLRSIDSAFAVERAAAAQALSGYTGTVVVGALTRALADENWHVREWSARSLGSTADVQAVPALVTGLADDRPTVREWSARALGEIGSPDAVDGLMQSLSDTNSDVREWSARSLGDIGSPRAIDALLASLQDSSGEVREWSARALGRIGSPRAVDALVGALQDPDGNVREWSIRALGDIGDRRAADAIAAAGDDGDADVREWSERVLARWQ